MTLALALIAIITITSAVITFSLYSSLIIHSYVSSSASFDITTITNASINTVANASTTTITNATITTAHATVRGKPNYNNNIRDENEKSDKDYERFVGTKQSRKLEFVHITKTGGSSIEKAAAAVGIPWGACHYIRQNDLKCSIPDMAQNAPLKQKIRNATGGVIKMPGSYTSWHVPPSFFKQNPFRGADTFTVVRNIYDRMISEYYCKWSGYKGRDNKNDVKVMNKWLQDRIQENMKQQQWHFHFCPQYLYVFDFDDDDDADEQGKKDGRQTITHVLRFENLHEEFSNLMSLYNLNVTLPLKKINEGLPKKNIGKLSSKHLSPETVALINQRYANDFYFFGYTKWDPNDATYSYY